MKAIIFLTSKDGNRAFLVTGLPEDSGKADAAVLEFIEKTPCRTYQYILLEDSCELEPAHFDGRGIGRELSVTEKVKAYLRALDGRVDFHCSGFCPKGEEASDIFVEKTVCDDFYIRDGQLNEGYIRSVSLDKDGNVSVEVCLNRCGVSYDDVTEFPLWDLSGDNMRSILSFIRLFGDARTVKRLTNKLG